MLVRSLIRRQRRSVMCDDFDPERVHKGHVGPRLQGDPDHHLERWQADRCHGGTTALSIVKTIAQIMYHLNHLNPILWKRV